MSDSDNEQSRPYHHGDLRDALIAKGEEIVSEGGGGTLTLREAARRAGVSHNAPYSHFAGKIELLCEVAVRGFDRLTDELEATVAQAEGDHRQALINVGRAHVRFGLAHPGIFRLMFGAELAEYGSSARLESAAKAAFGVLERVLAEGADTGLFKKSEHAALASWALMHGLTLLMLDQRANLPGNPELGGMLAAQVGELLINGIARPR